MNLMLGYEDKKGAHITMPIKAKEVREKLIWLAKKGFSSTLWEEGERDNELGGTYKHPEVGWTWYFDNDILK
jgi:hypothetical protein